MASVFTFEPEPPKLFSPWGPFPARRPRLDPSSDGNEGTMRLPSSSRVVAGLVAPPPLALAECGVARLEAEPQEGPTEYKLHLLLRPRRSFLSISTRDKIAGSQYGHAARPMPERSAVSEPSRRSRQQAASPQPTPQSRLDRLQHLTTQLLWRLHQSSPYHSASAVNLVIPRLPEATPKLGVPPRPEKLIPGLESSRGALYEIGVSDNGSFVGLTEDELDESLTNLRAMAASLGCNVEILRFVTVGDCEWYPQDLPPEKTEGHISKEPLFVVEALVFPETHPRSLEEVVTRKASNQVLPLPAQSSGLQQVVTPPKNEVSQTEQLRVSLTGRTTAGKSSLIGTISTSTLDNGRGKSRLSLLKHRHEIATGVTSSVAPELIGYTASRREEDLPAAVINYSFGNVSSWDDVHNSAEGGRLVFLTDSAGHPRFRNTIVSGLVSWAPHWTLCCIPADENLRHGIASIGAPVASDPSDQEDVTRSSLAHLGLCLKLQLQLIVVITKQDRATKENLRQCLSIVLSMIKASGKKPSLMIRPGSATDDPHAISVDDERAAKKVFCETNVVPIILTSALSGNGIGQLHALLRTAPIPQPEPATGLTPPVLFHVGELYLLSHASVENGNGPSRNLVVLGGHLRYGQLTVGDLVQVGPFLAEVPRESLKEAPLMVRTSSNPSRLSVSPIPRLSRSMPRFEQQDSFTPPPSTPVPAPFQGEFFLARVVSIRNLRLPLMTLLQDQAGTVGIEFPPPNQHLIAKLRKGMVLAKTTSQESLSATSRVDPALRPCVSIQVRFNGEDYEIMEPGAMFIVYIASVRAVAKILTVEAVSRDSFNPFQSENPDESVEHGVPTPPDQSPGVSSADDAAFGELEESFEEFGIRSEDDITGGRRMIDVVFNFVFNPEWIEQGALVLAMPGNAIAGGVGLDGFVGYVIDTRE